MLVVFTGAWLWALPRYWNGPRDDKDDENW